MHFICKVWEIEVSAIERFTVQQHIDREKHVLAIENMRNKKLYSNWTECICDQNCILRVFRICAIFSRQVWVNSGTWWGLHTVLSLTYPFWEITIYFCCNKNHGQGLRKDDSESLDVETCCLANATVFLLNVLTVKQHNPSCYFIQDDTLNHVWHYMNWQRKWGTKKGKF